MYVEIACLLNRVKMRLKAHIYYTLTASIAGGVMYMCDVCLSFRPSVGLSHVVPAPDRTSTTEPEESVS